MSLFLMDGHSFQRICTKFGMHVASLYPPDGHGGQRAPLEPVGSRSARRLYAAADKWRATSGNSELVAERRKRET